MLAWRTTDRERNKESGASTSARVQRFGFGFARVVSKRRGKSKITMPLECPYVRTRRLFTVPWKRSSTMMLPPVTRLLESPIHECGRTYYANKRKSTDKAINRPCSCSFFFLSLSFISCIYLNDYDLSLRLNNIELLNNRFY